MATINLQWIPANNANATGQRMSAIAKVNGTLPNMTSGFSPANIMGKAVGSASFTTPNVNLVYRFMVETICTTGGPTPNNNGIKEGIQFACIPHDAKAMDSTNVTYNARVFKNLYTFVDDVSYPTGISSISGVEFSLYLPDNITRIQGPFPGTISGTGINEVYQYIFQGLTPNTPYKLHYVLLASVDGQTVRSDAPGYLTVSCQRSVTTTGNSDDCRRYQLTNTGGGFPRYTFYDCAGVFADGGGTGILNPGQVITICAVFNSINVDPGISVSVLGNCIFCYRFENQTTEVITDSYVDCGGTTRLIELGVGGSVCGRTGPAGTTQTIPC